VADIIKGGHRGIKNAKADGEFDVAEAEGGTERIGGGGLSVFTGMVEKEKGNVGHVNHSMLEGRRVKDGESMSVVDEAE
jgi:hypothetical protein